MAIIIPSSCIYNSNNNKLINNKIEGVSYNQFQIRKKTTIFASHNLAEGSSASSSDIMGTYIYTSENERKILISNVARRYYQFTLPSSFPNSNIVDWSVIYTKITQKITNPSKYITTEISANKLMSYSADDYPKPPDYNVGEEELYSYAYYLMQDIARTQFILEAQRYIQIYYAAQITINCITEEFKNNNWVETQKEERLSIGTDTYNTVELYSDYSTTFNQSVTIGNQFNSFALPNTDMFTSTVKVNGEVLLGNYVAEKVIENYKNGKETATLLCSISNYYDENGNQVKSDSGENIVFNIYDEVVPMVYKSNSDVPMSLSKDGKAKTFVVLGVEVFYDGAVWQRITLQETGKSIKISLKQTIKAGTYVFNEFPNSTNIDEVLTYNTKRYGEIFANLYSDLYGLERNVSINYIIFDNLQNGGASIKWGDNRFAEGKGVVCGYNVSDGSTTAWGYDFTYPDPDDPVEDMRDVGVFPDQYSLDCRTLTVTTNIEVDSKFYQLFMAKVVKID